jgi:signal transduction histidine kinase
MDVLGRLGMAFGAVATATLLTILCRKFQLVAAQRVGPFFFLGAVLACSWLGGYTGGIISVVFSACISVLLTRRTLDFSQVDPYRFALLVLLSSAVSWIASHRRKLEVELRSRVEQKTTELQNAVASLEREITERKAAEEEIRRLNQQLELRVDERTRQLEVSNRELESFSYSVSHDLRAPLRSIDGFSRILLTSFPQKLDDEEKALFQRILAATGRMNELIDDLLNLARVTRTAIHVEAVDLSKAAWRITEILRRDHPGTATEFLIQPGLTATCDLSLAEVLLNNLLENAWKFSSQAESPCVEFGATSISGERVLFVRDNGAGFDPEYKSKLFAPFQRLHRQDEFPGTGIGLATVARIVHRHGGWINAESQLGKGATFFFTLSASESQRPDEPKPPAPRLEAPNSSSIHSALT